MPKFVVKDMETLFMDEVRQSINLLISNLESVPVTPRGQTVGKRKDKSRYDWPSEDFLIEGFSEYRRTLGGSTALLCGLDNSFSSLPKAILFTMYSITV